MASNPVDHATLLVGLERLVSDDLIDNDAGRVEYLLLGRGILPHVTDIDFEQWSSMFATYPHLVPQQVGWIANHQGEGSRSRRHSPIMLTPGVTNNSPRSERAPSDMSVNPVNRLKPLPLPSPAAVRQKRQLPPPVDRAGLSSGRPPDRFLVRLAV